MVANTKLPKQWKHWARMNMMKLHSSRTRKDYDYFNLKGHNHYWRVNCHGMFQISCPIEDFDRWANSFQAETELPKTRTEFFIAVNLLLASAKPVDMA